jgi:hypothetical protein
MHCSFYELNSEKRQLFVRELYNTENYSMVGVAAIHCGGRGKNSLFRHDPKKIYFKVKQPALHSTVIKNISLCT